MHHYALDIDRTPEALEADVELLLSAVETQLLAATKARPRTSATVSSSHLAIVDAPEISHVGFFPTAGDNICTGSGSIAAHLGYGGSASERAAVEFAAGKLNAALGAGGSTPTNPTQPPTCTC
jgi:hypothetical protein